MRCLTLADFLMKTGHQTFFICRDHARNLAQGCQTFTDGRDLRISGTLTLALGASLAPSVVPTFPGADGIGRYGNRFGIDISTHDFLHGSKERNSQS